MSKTFRGNDNFTFELYDRTTGKFIPELTIFRNDVDSGIILRGNIVVDGTVVTVNTANSEIDDQYFTLNRGQDDLGIIGIGASGNGSSGLRIDRGPIQETVGWEWYEQGSNKYWRPYAADSNTTKLKIGNIRYIDSSNSTQANGFLDIVLSSDSSFGVLSIQSLNSNFGGNITANGIISIENDNTNISSLVIENTGNSSSFSVNTVGSSGNLGLVSGDAYIAKDGSGIVLGFKSDRSVFVPNITKTAGTPTDGGFLWSSSGNPFWRNPSGNNNKLNKVITGTTNEIVVTNGDGVAGEPTISFATNPIFSGAGAIGLPNGTTAQRPSPVEGHVRINNETGTLEFYINGAWVASSVSGDVPPFLESPSGISGHQLTTVSYEDVYTNQSSDTQMVTSIMVSNTSELSEALVDVSLVQGAWGPERISSFSVLGENSITNGLFFKPDGTKLYIIGESSTSVYQHTLSTPWDISTASYDFVSFDVSGQGTSPQGLFFKSDGTRLYMVDATNDSVYQYTLSTPWDISTASYDSLSFDVSGQDTIPTGLFFKPDGTKLYVVGDSNNTVYQYTLSTPWDISTTSYDSVSFSVSSQVSVAMDLFFSPDGTKLYSVHGISRVVYQYTLSTPWDISTASYDSVSFSVSQFGPIVTGLFFKDDGTKLYVVGRNLNSVLQYTLSTPWDISTASYDSISYYLYSQDDFPYDLFFKPDGTKLYMVGNSSDSVHQYTLSTPWDISTASYDSVSFSVSGQEITPQGLFFKDDGTKLYIIGSSSDSVYQYTLSTPWDISTASYDSVSFSVSGQETTPQGLFFKSDGTKLYIIGSSSNTVYQYTLSTPWDISTTSYDSVSFGVGGQDTNPTGLYFKSDGTKLYIIGSSSDSVYQYTLIYDWELVVSLGISYDNISFNVGGQTIGPSGLFFKNDGSKLYIIDGDASDTIYQYTLSTPWDVSTITYDSVSFSVSGQDVSPQGLFFKDDGTKLYVIGTGSDSIHQYTLSTPWDISTTTYDSVSFSVSGQDTDPSDVFFKSDGSKLYVIGNSSLSIHQYTLSTPWDISTTIYDSVSFNFNENVDGPTGLFFKNDGTKLYIVESTKVHKYTLSTPWDITTTTYGSVSFSVINQENIAKGISFKDDGTKMYIVGSGNDSVYQYSVGTTIELSYQNVLDVSTATELLTCPIIIQNDEILRASTDLSNNTYLTVSYASTDKPYYTKTISLDSTSVSTFLVGSTNGDVINSIRIVNDDPSPATPETPGKIDVWWEDENGVKTYFVTNFEVLPGMAVDILDKDKFLPVNASLKLQGKETGRLNVIVTGIQK